MRILIKSLIKKTCHAELVSASQTHPYPSLTKGGGRKAAFTLAEVLITLGIIGVVAAITMPVLINQIQDRQYSAARKKVLVSIAQSCRSLAVDENLTSAVDAKDFVENYLSKHLQIIQTCDNENLKNCGLLTDTNSIKTYEKKNLTMPKKMSDLNSYMSASHTIDPNSKSYGFVMSNGYAVNLFYNPKCFSPNQLFNNEYLFTNYSQDYVCVNVVYDMNGLAAPNRFGKDINFVTVFYPDSTSIAVAPDVYPQDARGAKYSEIGISCSEIGKDYVPLNFEDFGAMVFNRVFYANVAPGASYWLGSRRFYSVSSWGGYLAAYPSNSSFGVRCKKL